MEEKKKIQSFRDLITWQEGHRLVLLVYAETKRFPKEEMFGLTSQMRRCAVSITSNTAEGFSRQSYKEKIQFYSIAQGSVTELQNQLLVSKDVGYLKHDEYSKAADQAEKVHRILNGLLKSSKNFSRGYAAVCLSLFFILYSLFSLPLPASAAVLGKPANNLGLTGYWPLNEGVGTVYGDASGNGNNGSVTGAPTWVNGKRGKALQFDGSDDHFIATDSIFLRQGNDWTASAWIKIKNPDPGSGADRIIVGKQGWHGGFIRIGDAVQFSITNTAGDRVFVSYDATPDVWYHYVATYTGASGAMEMFVNGISAGTATFNTATTMNYQSQTDLYFGGSGTDQYHTFCEVDEIRIYNRKLTAAQIQALYGSGAQKLNSSQNNRLTNGLVGLWSFNGADISNGVALDRSGQGNNGNLYNIATSTFYSAGKVGQAFNFDGADDVVDAGAANSLLINNASTTLSAWVNVPTYTSGGATADRGTILQKTGMYYLTINSSTGKLDAYFAGPVADHTSSTSVVPLNEWVHVAVTYDQSNIRWYINGVLDKTLAATGPVTTDARTFKIGGETGFGRFINGKIDEVRVYNRTLSASEIKQLYQMGSQKTNAPQNNRLTNGLINMWSFNGPDISNGAVLDRIAGNSGYPKLIATSTFYTAGKVGQGLEFDGTNKVDLASTVSLGHASNWTVSMWVKTSYVAADQYLLTNQSGGPVTNAMRIDTNGKMNYYHYNGVWNSHSGTITVSDGNWHHLTWANSSNATVAMYVDGVLDATVASDNSGPLNRIGNVWDSGSNGLIGTMDEMRFYNRTLTASEVKQLYDLGR